MEVLVFSTSVASKGEVTKLTPMLNTIAGAGKWNFALDDSDRILRIVSEEVKPIAAIQLLRQEGFECRELEN